MISFRNLFYFLFPLLILFFSSCEKEETPEVTPEPPVVIPPTGPDPDPVSVEKGDFRIGFYNVENLFDTQDDPNNEKDDEFLPNAAKQWTGERYQKKLENIGRVIQGADFPVLMGLSEVENDAVLEDLVKSDLLKDQNYGIVHHDSPDFRGIDVALLYQPNDFQVLSSESIEVVLPSSVSQFATTRDILLVKGILKQDTVYVFVNHWPSRSGGVAATNGKRVFAATVLKGEIDDILSIEPSAAIIVLGDFNDEPYNESLAETLAAKTDKPTAPTNELFNCTVNLTQAGEGSYFFGNDWQMLDQAIVSGQLLDDMGSFKVTGFNVFKENFVLFEHPTDGWRPNRTYGGDEYFGGFSDHLAVFLEVENL